MLDRAVAERIERVRGRRVVTARPALGGYTPAERWVVGFDDGTSAFAKVGVTPLTAAWVRAERHWYSRLSGRFLPGILGWDDDGDRPLLLLEDLSAAHWPPPWTDEHVDALLATLRRVASTRPLPDDLPPLERSRELLSGWARVARDPGPFLALGMCSPGWLADALPALCAAEAVARLAGDDLLHFDVRSDNVCFAGERVVLVDWNAPARGDGAFDVIALAPSLRCEGGPLPEELWAAWGDGRDPAPEAALVAGYFASMAGREPIPDAPRVRWIQLRQLRIALPWACRALDLPEPDGRWAIRETERLDADLAAGRITEHQWHEGTEEVIGDAYLASADPRAGSGKGGDEVEWRWSRELVLDVCRPGDAVLDVGCANGYLMESLARWGGERGCPVEPYGLEISPRLAALARRNVRRWADRIWEGNVLTWTPRRRFDVVHTGLDYVAPNRRAELVRRVLDDYLAPGGRLILRPERVGGDGRDPAAELEDLGVGPVRVHEATHPATGALRRTASLARP